MALPVTGDWAVCQNPEVVQKHKVKVYAPGAPGAGRLRNYYVWLPPPGPHKDVLCAAARPLRGKSRTETRKAAE